MNRLLLNLGLLGIIGIVMAGATLDSLEFDKSIGAGKLNAHQVRLACMVDAERTKEPKYPLGGGTVPTPTPPPTPTPCVCPEDPPETGTLGGIRCGDGCEPNICTWLTAEDLGLFGSDESVQAQVNQCLASHEQIHLNDENGGCSPTGWWSSNSAQALAETECEAFTDSLRCLADILFIDDFKTSTSEAAAYWCTLAGEPVPTPLPPNPNTVHLDSP